jgi:hypothetical protein
MITIRFYLYLCILFSGGVSQMFIWTRMVRQINRHLPANEQYSLSIWSFWKSAWGELNQFRIWRAYRRFFPDSYLPLWYVGALVLTVSWMLFGLGLLNA